MKPERVYGVDFSGAKDAGRKIWIASGVVDDDKLRLDVCDRAATYFDSGPDLERALAALRDFIGQQAPCVVGLDFPFGLPRVLAGHDRWEDFVLDFGNRYATAEGFRKVCKQADGGKELQRVTDVDAKTPFSPYHEWLYKQTFYGIRDVLAPLVRMRAASVLPMQAAAPRRVWLIEICPASTLKCMGIYQSYKDAKYAQVRASILTKLEQLMGAEVEDSIRREVIKDNEGDALDSVIAAAATFRALRDSIDVTGQGTPTQVEGFVYV